MLIKVKKEIALNIFYFLSAVLFLFLVAELLWPNSVLSYVNLNYLFVLWLFSWLVII
jgi:hypothetical protein